MSKGCSQGALESCLNLLKKIETFIVFPVDIVDCEFYKQLQLAHRVLYRSEPKDASPHGREISNPSSVHFHEDGNSKKVSGINDNSGNLHDFYGQDDSSAPFLQSDALWSVILSAFYCKKTKISEKALVTLNNLLLCSGVDFNIQTHIFMHPFTSTSEPKTSKATTLATKVTYSVGEGLFHALTEFLGTTSDPTLQSSILFHLHELLKGKGQEFLTTQSVERVLLSVLSVAVWTCQESLYKYCQKILELCALCVIRRFVKESLLEALSKGGPSGSLSHRFTTRTPLDDYTTHITTNTPYTCIDVIDLYESTNLAHANHEDPETLAIPEKFVQWDHTNQGGVGCCSVATTSFNVHSWFPTNQENLMLKHGMQVFDTKTNKLPNPLKNLLVLIRIICNIASYPYFSSLNEDSVELRPKQLALNMLQLVFSELPIANCIEEHPCSTWISLILSACGFEIIGCIVRSLTVIAPVFIFNTAIQILELVLIKFHYHLARELHAVIVTFLLPVVKSQHCDFRRKYAVLSMLHNLFSSPHLLISLFINYDCNPAIGADVCSSDMVETLVNFITESVYQSYSSGDQGCVQLSREEKLLLGKKCFAIMNAIVNSLYRWISEDPWNSGADLISGDNARHSITGWMPNKLPMGKYPLPCEWMDMTGNLPHLFTNTKVLSAFGCKDNPKDFSQRSTHPIYTMPFSNTHAECKARRSHFEDALQTKESTICVTGQLEGSYIKYHWKHIHYLLNNKHILHKAACMINLGKWKEAKGFLESHKCFTVLSQGKAVKKGDKVSGVASIYTEFARFLHEYPGISRSALNKIIERVTKKDGDVNQALLKEYFALLHYKDVPIDIAFRDTICRFVSWEMPMFEAEVWEKIQSIFGEAYAKQNPLVITSKDADTMAGALLFLHTSLHNTSVKNTPISLDEFISASTDFLDFPPDVENMRRIFERVKKKKWELDMYNRTPQEVERQLRRKGIFSRLLAQGLVWKHQAVRSTQSQQSHRITSVVYLDAAARNTIHAANFRQGGDNMHRSNSSDNTIAEDRRSHFQGNPNSISNQSNPTTDYHKSVIAVDLQELETDSMVVKSPSTNPNSGAIFTPKSDHTRKYSLSHNSDFFSSNTGLIFSLSSSNREFFYHSLLDEIALLNGKAPAYLKHIEKPKTRGGHQMGFMEESMFYLRKLEAIHIRFFGSYADYHPQPYISPHYAEHAQPLLLLIFPRILASIYLGFSTTEAAPARCKLLETLQLLYDISAIFMINVNEQVEVVTETVRQYLGSEDIPQLVPEAQTLSVPFILNFI